MNTKHWNKSFLTGWIALLASMATLSAEGLTRKWLDQKDAVTDGAQESLFNKLALDSVGNAFTVGSTDDFRKEDGIVQKLASGSGVVLWELILRIDGYQDHEIKDIVVDGNDDLVITGSVYDPVWTDVFTIKLSGTDGSVIWEMIYQGRSGDFLDDPAAIAVDAANNVVVTGASERSSGNEDYFTVKYAAATGAQLWVRRYNGSINDRDFSRDVKIDQANDVIVTGFSGSLNGNDYYTAKYSGRNGSLLWEKRYDGQGHSQDAAFRLALDPAGNAFVTGFSYNSSDRNQQDALTVKYAGTDGRQLWVNRFDSSAHGDDGATDIAVDSGGDVVVLGYSQKAIGNTLNQGYLAKYSGVTGAPIWQTFASEPGGYDSDEAEQLTLDSAGNVVVTGNGYLDGKSVFCTVKRASATGAVMWENKYTWETTRPRFQVRHRGFAVEVDPSGNVIATGISSNPASSSDHFTINYAAGSGTILWTNRYNGPISRSNGPGAVAVDHAGNTVSTGYWQFADHGIHVWKNDGATGALLWEQQYAAETDNDDQPVAIAVDASDHVFVASRLRAVTRNFEYSVTKHEPTGGTILWHQRILPPGATNARLNDMVVDSDGNVIVTGTANPDRNYDFYTVKLAADSGEVLWEQWHDGSGSGEDEGRTLAIDPSGDVFVMGTAESSSNKRPSIIIKYAGSDGAKLWELSDTDPKNHVFYGITTDGIGNVIATGASSRSEGSSMSVAKYAAANGTLLWEKLNVGSDTSVWGRGASVKTDAKDDVVVTGTLRLNHSIGGHSTDCYTAKFAADSGNLLWDQTYQGEYLGDDEAEGLVIDGAGDVWIKAISESTSQRFGLYTAVYSGATGAPLGSDFYDAQFPESNEPSLGQHVIAIGGANRIAVTGYSHVPGPDSDTATILYERLAPQLVIEQPEGQPLPAGGGVDFGLVPGDTSSTLVDFVMRNTGNAALTINGISVSGGDAEKFEVIQPPSSSVPAGGTSTFQIKIHSTTVGNYSTTLQVRSNDLLADPWTTALSFLTPSQNADLATLTVNTGAFTPLFAPETTLYRMTVPFPAEALRIGPVAADATASVTVNGDAVPSGGTSQSIALPVGSISIPTIVTAQDSRFTKSYELRVTRLPQKIVYLDGTEIPISADGFVAEGQRIDIELAYHPSVGTELTVVNNTGLEFIEGRFFGLEQAQILVLPYEDVNYRLVADYFGGTGNDLVLRWADTKAYGWGSNDYGQLGMADGSRNPLLQPTEISGGSLPGAGTLLATSTGYLHSLYLTSDGRVAAGGYNVFGQLGDGSLDSRAVPELVDSSTALAGKTVVAISAGAFHNLALCADGSVVAWGYNNHGQLGNGTMTTSTVPVAVRAGALAGKTAIAVSAGAYHSVALCSDGSVIAWGFNETGSLGNGLMMNSAVPVAVHTDSGTLSAIAICAGRYHCLALRSDGTIMAWGYNEAGQLGNNSTESANLAVPVDTSGALLGKVVTSIATGGSHSLAICRDGTVVAWGQGGSGQLGDGLLQSRLVPIESDWSGTVAGLSAVAPGAGASFSLALCADGTAVTWGDNAQGQLGNGGTNLGDAPDLVLADSLGVGERFVRISSGSSSAHSIVIVAFPTDSTSITMMESSTREFARADSGTDSTIGGTPNTSLRDWRLHHFARSESLGEAANLADPDQDGLANLIEYAFGLNPTQGSARLLPAWRREDGFMVLAFTEPSGVTDLRYGASMTENPAEGTWTSLTDFGTDREHVFRVPIEAQPRFMRLEVSEE